MRLLFDHSIAAAAVSVPCYGCGRMKKLSEVVSDRDGPSFKAYYCVRCTPADAVIPPCVTDGCPRCAAWRAA